MCNLPTSELLVIVSTVHPLETKNNMLKNKQNLNDTVTENNKSHNMQNKNIVYL